MARIDLKGVRAGLYVLLLLFTLICLALCASRISYVDDRGVYEDSIVELLVTNIFVLLWCGVMLLLFLTSTTTRVVRYYRDELIALVILWVLWLGGAAAASNRYDGIEGCHSIAGCRYLDAILAFAWMGWIVLTALIGIASWISWRYGLTTELHVRSARAVVTPKA